MQGIMLHCGASAATRDQVFDAATPDATETHYPLPHGALIEVIETHVRASGFEIATEEYGLWKDGARMFGVWGLTTGNGVEHEDFQLVMGVRNSHDKAFSAGLAVGSRVFVCDNLAFSSEIVIARSSLLKYTFTRFASFGKGCSLYVYSKVSSSSSAAIINTWLKTRGGRPGDCLTIS